MALNPFIASITTVAFNFEPRGFAFCDGRILSIASNTALFSLLGITYGGNGTTNFALPDLRGKYPIHPGQGPGLSLYTLGQVGGVENTILTTNAMPAHTHNVTIGVNTNVGEESNPTNNKIASKANRFSQNSNATLGGVNAIPQGGGQPFNNRNPYLAVNFCIALQGVFPPRS